MKTWDPDSCCPDNFAMVLIGKRRSGKSTLLKSLCAYHWKNKYPSVYVFSQTAFNGYFEDFVPRKFIWNEWKEDKINEIVERQKKLVMRKRAHGSKENVNALLILDDVAHVRYSQSLERLFFQARHYCLSIIVAIQDATILSRNMRDQADMLIVWRQSNKLNRDRVIEGFLAVKDPQEGENVLREATDGEHNVLVINNCVNSYVVEDFTYTYSAKLPPRKFRMGASHYWDEMWYPQPGEQEGEGGEKNAVD